jgi:glutathione S-transferase
VKLYYSRNLNPRVAVAVARHLESPVEFIRASPRDPRNEEAFRLINPNTLVPVLVEADRVLWETDAIACRLSMLARSDFWPGGELAPELQMWVSWSAHHFTRAAATFYWERLMKATFGLGPPDDAALGEATGEFHRFARVLDDFLAAHRWLVADRLSYADFRVATALPFAENAGMPLEGYAHIREWHARLWELPAWRAPFEGLASEI